MNDQPIRKRRRLGYLGMLGLCAALGLAIGFASALIDAFGGASADLLQTGMLIASMAVVFWICVVWWRGADEAVREAHKWAWYWGGSAGIVVVIVVLGLGTWDVIDLVPADFSGDPSDLVLTGAGLTLGVQMTGYLIAWAFWWLRHR